MIDAAKRTKSKDPTHFQLVLVDGGRTVEEREVVVSRVIYFYFYFIKHQNILII